MPQRRKLIDQGDIEPGVYLAQGKRREIHHVDMARGHLGIAGVGLAADGVSSPAMTGARGHAEHHQLVRAYPRRMRMNGLLRLSRSEKGVVGRWREIAEKAVSHTASVQGVLSISLIRAMISAQVTRRSVPPSSSTSAVRLSTQSPSLQ